MAQKVEGKLYESITGQLFELGRQLRQKNGYPFDPNELQGCLQDIIEGKFKDNFWRVEEDGTVRLKLTGIGLTGLEWEKRLESKGFKLSKSAKDLLNSPDFTSCEKDKVYEVVILSGKLFSDRRRTTKNILAEGDCRGLIHGSVLPIEIACLIRENFSNEQFKKIDINWLTTMHEPIEDHYGGLHLFSMDRGDDGFWLSADYAILEGLWRSGDGYIFLSK